MTAKFSATTNIIRDTERELNYIPTPNTIRIANQLSKDFEKGLRAFNIIGSYGSGKSTFLWALEQTILEKKSLFGTDLGKNANVKILKLVGSHMSLRNALCDELCLEKDKNNATENLFLELFSIYKSLGNGKSLLIIEIDEFGKYLEYASQNEPESELYFIQQLAEFVSNPAYKMLLITTVHQNFDAYASNMNDAQRNEWTKVKGRFKEITFNEPVEQLLYLAAEHLEEKSSKEKSSNEIEKLVTLLVTSKAFNVNEDYVHSIAKKIYPLDVFSAYVVTHSLQKYGQNERSLFSFLESVDHTSLYQHEILNRGFYSITDVYDYLVYNFYSFINSRYNPDFSVWRTIKISLERIQAVFDKDIDIYENIVKIIGLLSLNARVGAKLDANFLGIYCETSMGIKDIKKYISNLEKKRIILFRNYSNRYILTEGTDLDIQGALFDAAKKIDKVSDIVTLLHKNYPLSPIVAKRAMFETGTPRLFEYVISAEPVSRKPSGDVDGFINLIFNVENIQHQILEKSSRCEEAILYCYYKNSKEIEDLLFEIEKTQKVIEENFDDKVALSELQNIIAHQRNLLNHKIVNSLYGDSSKAVWVFKGVIRKLKSQKDFNQFLSQICREVYHQTPYFNNELVNKNRISASIHTAKKNYFKSLANDWDIPKLGFPENKYPPEKTIYLSLLENNGIQLCNNDSLLGVEPHDENGFGSLWHTSLDFLNNARTGKRNVSDLVNILSNRPFRLKQGFIDFWIPSFLFIKRDEFALFNLGIYTPSISEDILERVSKVPNEFEVKSFALEGVKLDIFNSYRKFLNIESNENGRAQTFIETIRPFLVFYRGLPDYSKQTKRLSKESIGIREAIASSKDPEQSFFEDFPTALGYSVSIIQKDRTELQHFIIRLQDSIKEVRNSFDELVNRFETFLQDKYFDKPLVFEEYKKGFQKRYKNLHRHLLLNSQKSFVQRVDSQIEDRKAWLSSLAQSLIGRTLEKFKDEDELMLYDKFSEMILSLDSLNRISKSKFDEEKEIAIDVQINSFGEEMANKVIRLPKSKNKQVEKLEEKIKELLSKDKSIDLAAITAVLKDLL